MYPNLNDLELNLEKSFEELLNSDSLTAIKAEFEAEGTRIEELIVLSELCCKKNIDFTLKIGGPSAQRDFYEAFQLGAKNILIPMIESEYSLLNCVETYLKFLPIFKHLKTTPKLFINIESDLSFKNLEKIIDTVLKEKLPLSTIVIGRSDLSESLKIKDVNSKKILNISEKILQYKNLFNITLGGNLTFESFNFISYLNLKGLNSFESRKCTFKSKVPMNYEEFYENISLGLQFELSWLKYKKAFYSNRSNLDNNRIKIIESRLNK